MSALQDIDEYCEQHRQRLHDALSTLVNWSHADGECKQNPTQCLNDDYETVLKQIDTYAYNTGTPWHAVLAHMVQVTESTIQRINNGEYEEDE